MSEVITETEETGQEETMSLTEEENNTLMALRQRATALSNEIGSLEIRKARLIGAVSSTEAQANELLQSVADRLEIPQGTTWQVTPEGVIIVTESPE